MNVHGSCTCGNIEISWNVDDISQQLRACQCEYCLSKNAAYVSRAGSDMAVTIHNPKSHRIVRHGTNTADFHECTACNMLAFVSSDIEGMVYGIINSNCLTNINFDSPVKMKFTHETEPERLSRRRQNWCQLSSITIKADDRPGCVKDGVL